jgi:hypothetical protein
VKNILYHLNISLDEFQFQFQSHPDYPSALAFSDTLSFIDIKKDAYELDTEYWVVNALVVPMLVNREMDVTSNMDLHADKKKKEIPFLDQ